MRSYTIFLILISILGVPKLMGQQFNPNKPANQKLRVYLEGEVKDFNYQRRSIHYVDFVQDPKLADIQVICTRVMLGSGGRRYFLNFYTGQQRDVIDFKQSFIREVNDTDDHQRIRFRKALEIGLLHYLNESSLVDQVEISYIAKATPVNEAEPLAKTNDPWNLWVFRLTGTGGWDLEESKSSIKYSGSIQADRVSETWLIRNYLSHQNSTRTYKQSESEVYKSINIVDKAQSRAVYTLSDHWSTGAFLNASRSTYLNTDFSIYVKPAIEYNIFDWKDADQKTFTLAYFMGPAYYKYRDTTFLNKTQESLWEHNFLVQLEMVQPWGEVDVQLGYEGYLNDLNNYNLSAEADISLRISKGLSVYFELAAQSLHNQLYLPKDEVSLEELLLNSRKLPTTFEFGGEIGFRFYFGSIYNNIVNERL